MWRHQYEMLEMSVHKNEEKDYSSTSTILFNILFSYI